MPHTWGRLLAEQLDFYVGAHLRPRLAGLSDEEYLWEPVPDCWSVRPTRRGTWRIDWAHETPSPSPVTTIAWRLVHIAVYNLGARVSTFFGDGSVPDEVPMGDRLHLPPIPGSAADAVRLLDSMARRWRDGVAAMDDDALLAPLGPKAGHYADSSMAQLALHVNRETFHHGGEIGVLRDLYLRRASGHDVS
jgi:hypothetical protein